MARESGAGHGDDRVHLRRRGRDRGGGGICPDPRESHSPSSAFAGTSRVVDVAILPRRRRGLPACPADWLSRQGDRSSCDRSLAPPAARPLVGSCLDRRRRAPASPAPPHSSHEVFHLERLCLSFFVYQVNCTESRQGACKCNVSHRKHEPKRVWGGGYHKGISTLPLTIETTRKLPKKEKNGDEKSAPHLGNLAHHNRISTIGKLCVSSAARFSAARSLYWQHCQVRRAPAERAPGDGRHTGGERRRRRRRGGTP